MFRFAMSGNCQSVGKCPERRICAFFRDRLRLFCTVGKMEADDNNDSDQFSDDDVYNNLDENDFDLFELTEEERAELANVLNDDDESGDELDDENLPLFFTRPRFQWSGGDYVEPRTPRKEFDRQPGPVRVCDPCMKAVDYFQFFYSDTVFSELVKFANDNAELKKRTEPQKNKGEWKKLTVEEIKAYYGLLIMKDILRLDRDAHYWHTGAEHFLLSTKFGGVMSRDRFFQIRRYLYFVDPKKDVDRGDKLHKIRYILDTVRRSFMDEYIPHKEVTVDEAMVPFKGRLGFKQFMKDKPVKFGIKLWVCADAVTAYCYNLEVYTGKHGGQINKLMGLSARVVIGLTKPIHNFGHIVFTDNFYTSPVLAKYLAGKDTYLCGTVRPNRIGYPADLVKTNAEIRRMPRGASEWRQCEGMVATAWKDNRLVHYLSSAHTPDWPPNAPSVTTQRRQKDGTVVEFQCPPSVAAYAEFMNGVDRLDQNTRQNKSKKSMKWYRRVETKPMETSIYNAYVIEGDTVPHKVDGKTKRDFLSFKLDLAHQLIGDGYTERHQTGGRPRSDVNNTPPRLDRTDHWPVAGVGKDHTCVVCTARHKQYRDTHAGVKYADNPNKISKTTMMCEKCRVYLCCNNHKDCFKVYHTRVQYV